MDHNLTKKATVKMKMTKVTMKMVFLVMARMTKVMVKMVVLLWVRMTEMMVKSCGSKTTLGGTEFQGNVIHPLMLESKIYQQETA